MSIKAQAILIIPGQSVNSGVWESALALGRTLKKAKKDYSIFTENQEVVEALDSSISKESIPMFDTKATRDLIVTLTNLEDKVSDVKWQQTDQEVELRLATDKGNIGNPSVAISRIHNSFDLKIFIGLNQEEAQLLDIIEDLDFSEGKSVFLETTTDTDLIPVLVYNFIKKNKLKLDGYSAQKLLDAIYQATDNFTNHQSAETFFIASKLMAIINKPAKSKNAKEAAKIDTMPTPTAPPTKRVDRDEKVQEESAQAILPQVSPVLVTSSETSPTQDSPILIQTEQTEITQATPEPEPIREIKEPEELPADYDPLAPAVNFPTPLNLDDSPPPKPQDNSPLPEAQ